MPCIIPVRDLKSAHPASRLGYEAGEPVMKGFQKAAFLDEVYEKLAEAEVQAAEGKTTDAQESLKKIRERRHV